MLDGELLGEFGISAQKDFRRRPLTGHKGRIQSSVLHFIMLALKIYFAFAPPKSPANAEELVCSLVSLVMFQKIAIIAELMRRVPSHNVDMHAPVCKRRYRVDLLYKNCRRHDSGTAGNHEFDFVRLHAKGRR